METQERTRERVAVQEKAQAKVRENSKPEGECPKCGAEVSPGHELCPVCGAKLVDYCTFCGAPMSPDDLDCPECGAPSEGIECPGCHKVRFRSFCGDCGLPLTRAAARSVEKAKLDPKVIKAAQVLTRVAELEAELEALGAGEEGSADDEAPAPTEGELRMRELMAQVGFAPAKVARPAGPKTKPSRTREQVLAEYRQAVEESNRALEDLLPPPGCTPQEQRNYCTSRKVAVIETVTTTVRNVIKERTGWICNKCHVKHDNPSQCYYREFGGHWVEGKERVEIITTTTKTKVYKTK